MVSGSVTLDLNTAGAVSAAIDVRKYLHWVVYVSASGTWNRAQVVYEWSLDGSTWLPFPKGMTQSSVGPKDFGTIEYARYIRAGTRTAEGSASTATISYYGNPVASDPFGVSAALGATAGEIVVIRGHRDTISGTVSNRAFDIFSTNSVSVHAYPGMTATAAQTITIQPSSANDTAAGTGAREITVVGIDASYAVVSESIATNGVTAVTTTQTFLRVNEAYVSSAGSLGRNADTITLQQTTSTLLMGQIYKHGGATESGYSRMLNAAYTVPAGKQLLVLERKARMSRKGTATAESFGAIGLSVRDDISTSTSPWIERWVVPVDTSGVMADSTLLLPDLIPEKSDVKARILQTDTALIHAAVELRCLLLDA